MKPKSGRGMELNEAIEAVREQVPPSEDVDRAAARVWERIAQEAGQAAASHEAIRGCGDVRALLPAHRQGALTGPRALLVEDHLRECAACRVVAREGAGRSLSVLPWRPVAAAGSPARAESAGWRRYAAAAAILLGVAGSAEAVRRVFFAVPSGSRAAVQSTSGVLQRVGLQQAAALRPGEEIGEAEAVRTANDAYAQLRLRDGSLVEMSERAELAVTARGQDTTIHLERGSIIVRAAKRRAGSLRVATRDCGVQVTGTVFSVNSGVKGSRVSVIEGHVRVSKGRQDRRLTPGEQWSTSEAMGSVPLRDEIAWSRELDQHLALLAEFRTLREKLTEVRKPNQRYESRLLQRLPDSTVVFASLPNYGEALGDAHRLFEQRLQESAALREWWARVDPARDGGPSLASVVERVRSFSEFLGDEIALGVFEQGQGHAMPVVLAEVRKPGLREFLEREIAALGPQPRGTPTMRIVDPAGLSAKSRDKAEVLILVQDDLVAVSGSVGALQRVSAPAGGGSGLEATAFGQRIGEAYDDGAGLLFAADLERVTASAARRQGRDAAALHESGIDGARHLVVEKDDLTDGRAHALVSFAGERRGIASWLAAPGPMGALDYVSPNAHLAAAVIAKSPALVLDDLLALARFGKGDPRQELSALEAKLELRLREDVALTLGGEFAFALDGPLLPLPAWKAIVEVVDPARLQASLELLLARASEEAVRAGHPGLRAEAEQVDGRTYHVVRGGRMPFELHYTYSDGYLIAASSRALVMQAIRAHDTGNSLAGSAAFQSLLSADGHSHVSGLLYQNIGRSLGAVLEAAADGLSPEQRGSLQALAQDARPKLLCAYGEQDAIQVAGSGGLLSLDPAELALPMLLQRAMPGTRGHATP